MTNKRDCESEDMETGINKSIMFFLVSISLVELVELDDWRKLWWLMTLTVMEVQEPGQV